jgi:glycosyltransferase involved in cell wall biosynthesis
MNNITVVLEVYNEEHRLEKCLKSFDWADELVVFVKKSTDNTLNIAQKYATHVYEVDYCNGSENVINNFKLHQFKDWCFCITASSLIDFELVNEIIKLTSDKMFNYDVIGLPYQMHVFNLSGSFSPWNNQYKYPLIRKNVLILSTELHNEISWDSNNIYRINTKTTQGRFKHFTHENPDVFFNKHIRYVKEEAIYYQKTFNRKALRKSFYRLVRAFAFVLIKRRTLFKGKDGFILSIAYLSYYIMLLTYVWYNNKHRN